MYRLCLNCNWLLLANGFGTAHSKSCPPKAATLSLESSPTKKSVWGKSVRRLLLVQNHLARRQIGSPTLAKAPSGFVSGEMAPVPPTKIAELPDTSTAHRVMAIDAEVEVAAKTNFQSGCVHSLGKRNAHEVIQSTVWGSVSDLAMTPVRQDGVMFV